MIVYPRGVLGSLVLTRIHGSAAYKAIIPSILSTIILIVTNYQGDNPNSLVDTRWFEHPYPIASLIVAFTFLLTFKCSFSYNRYWEALTSIQIMHSKWLDIGMELAAFHLQSKSFDEARPPSFGVQQDIKPIVRKRKRQVVLTTSGLKRLFDEDHSKSLEKVLFVERKKNLKEEGAPKHPPETDHSSRVLIPSFKNIESVSKLDGKVDVDMPSLFLQETAHLLSLLSAVACSTLRDDIEGTETPLVEWLPGSPFPPVDPDEKCSGIGGRNCYEMPKWRKVIYFLLGLDRSPSQRTLYNSCRPLGVLGGVSDAEVDLIQATNGPLGKTALCTFWLQEHVTREHLCGSLGNVAPPIISRLFQYTSDGMIGYNQARKVAYNPFPFPHSQLTTLFTLVMLIVVPILLLSFIHNVFVAIIFNELIVLILVGLYAVARELEDPFLNAPNDIPLNNLQAQFNEALLVMYKGFHPDAFWIVSKTQSNLADS